MVELLLLLCSWTHSSSFFEIAVSKMGLQIRAICKQLLVTGTVFALRLHCRTISVHLVAL
jgi:hypothetical protein